MSVTHDRLLGGQVEIVQPSDGFRAGSDSVLLAASLPEVETAFEAGCGAGGALLPAAWRLRSTRFSAVEQDPNFAKLTRQGGALNGFSDRLSVSAIALQDRPADWENQFDLSFSNPPFFDAARISAPGSEKAAAYLESLSLDDWVKHMVFVTRPRGTLILIHRAAALAELLSALGRRVGEVKVLPIRPAGGRPANRVLVRARKGLRPGPLTLLDGLNQSDASRWDAVMAGGALEWV